MSWAGIGSQPHGRKAATRHGEECQRKNEAQNVRENMLRTEMKRRKGKVFFSFYFTGSPYMLHGHASVKDLTRGQTFWEGKAEGPIKGIFPQQCFQ